MVKKDRKAVNWTMKGWPKKKLVIVAISSKLNSTQTFEGYLTDSVLTPPSPMVRLVEKWVLEKSILLEHGG